MKQKIPADTIIRTVVLTIALINQILTARGKNPLPFAENEIYELLTYLFTIGASVWAWWKNNSFTQAALKADNFMNALKSRNSQENERRKES